MGVELEHQGFRSGLAGVSGASHVPEDRVRSG